MLGTGRRRRAVGGVTTDGGVLHAVLDALRQDYEVYVVVDASASSSGEAHDAAVQRMVMAGAVPVTWWSIATEFQLERRFANARHLERLAAELQPAVTMAGRAFSAGAQLGRVVSTLM